MANSLFVWGLLVMIGVFDARDHRIPNYLVIAVFSIAILELLVNYHPLIFFIIIRDCFSSMMIFFAISFFIYCCRGMAAGDVKLISVIGFIIGQGSLIDYLQYTSWACVLIGSMYWMLNNLRRSDSSESKLKRPSSLNYLAPKVVLEHHSPRTINLYSVISTTHMPFAPILVIGLAMYQLSLH